MVRLARWVVSIIALAHAVVVSCVAWLRTHAHVRGRLTTATGLRTHARVVEGMTFVLRVHARAAVFGRKAAHIRR